MAYMVECKMTSNTIYCSVSTLMLLVLYPDSGIPMDVLSLKVLTV